MSAVHLTDEQLSAHLDSALPADEAATVASHLFGCGECSRRLDRLRATTRAIAGLPLESPPRELDLGFLREAPAAEAEVLSIAPPQRRRPTAWAFGGLAAAAVLLVAFLVTPAVLDSLRARTNATSLGLGSGGSAPSQATPGESFNGVAGPGGTAGPSLGGAAGAAPGADSTTARGTTQLTQQNYRSTPIAGPDGLALDIGTPTGNARAGDPIPVTVHVIGGNTDATLSPYSIVVRVDPAVGGPGPRLAGWSGDGIAVHAHKTQTFDFQWNPATGTDGPGRYTLVVRLTSGNQTTVVSVPISIN